MTKRKMTKKRIEYFTQVEQEWVKLGRDARSLLGCNSIIEWSCFQQGMSAADAAKMLVALKENAAKMLDIEGGMR